MVWYPILRSEETGCSSRPKGVSPRCPGQLPLLPVPSVSFGCRCKQALPPCRRRRDRAGGRHAWNAAYLSAGWQRSTRFIFTVQHQDAPRPLWKRLARTRFRFVARAAVAQHPQPPSCLRLKRLRLSRPPNNAACCSSEEAPIKSKWNVSLVGFNKYIRYQKLLVWHVRSWRCLRRWTGLTKPLSVLTPCVVKSAGSQPFVGRTGLSEGPSLRVYHGCGVGALG